MKITIVSGSHRKKSQSLKISNFLKERLIKLNMSSEINLIDLAEQEIPFWNELVWDNNESWNSIWTPINDELKTSDGFIFVSPDWGGMVPAKLKNFFLLCSSKSLGNKPGLLVSVSAGMGGCYPITELRTSSYKNTKICYLPEHLIIRNCNNVLNENIRDTLSEEDKNIRDRIDYTLGILQQYSLAFRSINVNDKEYPYGM